MSDFQHKDGSGSLFKNNKRDKETQPNAKGEAMVGGVLWEMGSWTRIDKNGNRWQSLSFKRKEARPPKGPEDVVWGSDRAKAQPDQDFDDEIPF